MSPLVLALAGTDHHPFERLVEWIDAAAVRLPEVRFVVQHGTTRSPSVAEGHSFLAQQELGALMAEAAVVVSHGGPGLIMEAREAGHVPLCVPRDPALGEHVDGHQKRFAAVVASAGVVRHVTSLADFHEALDHALSTAAWAERTFAGNDVRDAARARLAAELDRLIALAAPAKPIRRFRPRTQH